MSYNPTEDAPHVMLDALDLMRRTIDRDPKSAPWEGYEAAFGQVSGDGTVADVDPTKENYLAALTEAERLATAALETGCWK